MANLGLLGRLARVASSGPPSQHRRQGALLYVGCGMVKSLRPQPPQVWAAFGRLSARYA